ncbi:hypothetical protein MRX96_014236 [Rhipicephalus microplus]
MGECFGSVPAASYDSAGSASAQDHASLDAGPHCGDSWIEAGGPNTHGRTLTSSGEVAEAVFPCGGGGGLRPPSEIPSVSAAVRSACSPMEKEAGAPPASAYRTGYNVMSSRSSDGTNVCSIILTFISLLVISVTFPFSLFFCIKWPVLAAFLRPELASTPSFPAINLLRPELVASRRRCRVSKARNALRPSDGGVRSHSNPYERRIRLALRQSLRLRST